jgi:hypothetical protein
MYHTGVKKGFERECYFTQHIIDSFMAEKEIWTKTALAS